MEDIEKRLTDIEDRNARVELDKAWETSITRRLLITALTYVVIVSFLVVIDNEAPFINAIVPCLGFLLSTLTVSWYKQRWVQMRLKSRTRSK